MLDFIGVKLGLFNLSLVRILHYKRDLKYKLLEQKYAFESPVCIQLADIGLSHIFYIVNQQRCISPICYSQLKLSEHLI